MNKNGEMNVFRGKNSMLDFLNPDKNYFLPLVELPRNLNSFFDDGVRIYAKMLNMLPLSNVKSMPAFNMLKESKRRGRLDDVNTIIENSSGNTVLSLAVIGRLMGIENTKAYVSNEVLYGKLQMLRLFGVECLVNEEPICPDPADKTSGIYKAKTMSKKKGWINPGQYENVANPKAHEKWTARQIYEQLDGEIQVFCAGMGTTGTMVGCAKYFKKKNVNIKTVGVIRTPNNPVPGVRTRGLLKMIAFNWKKYVDNTEEIGTKDSFLNSLNLIRHGLVVGPSSGFALAGLEQFLKKMKDENKLDDLRNSKGKINTVFICCDSPFPYLKDYFQYLDDDYFPKIQGYDLLIDKPELLENKTRHQEGFELIPSEVFSLVFGDNKEKVKKKLLDDKSMRTRKNVEIVDLRSKEEFNHFHIPFSRQMDYGKLLIGYQKEVKGFKNKTVVVVCSLGLKSNLIVNALRKEGIEAFSLKGGIVEWSNQNFPRWKPEVCLRNNC